MNMQPLASPLLDPAPFHRLCALLRTQLAIIGRTQVVTDIPEHHFLKTDPEVGIARLNCACQTHSYAVPFMALGFLQSVAFMACTCTPITALSFCAVWRRSRLGPAAKRRGGCHTESGQLRCGREHIGTTRGLVSRKGGGALEARSLMIFDEHANEPRVRVLVSHP